MDNRDYYVQIANPSFTPKYSYSLFEVQTDSTDSANLILINTNNMTVSITSRNLDEYKNIPIKEKAFETIAEAYQTLCEKDYISEEMQSFVIHRTIQSNYTNSSGILVIPNYLYWVISYISQMMYSKQQAGEQIFPEYSPIADYITNETGCQTPDPY